MKSSTYKLQWIAVAERNQALGRSLTVELIGAFVAAVYAVVIVVRKLSSKPFDERQKINI